MDPLSASLLTGTLSALLGGAAGEAGRHLWQKLLRKMGAKPSTPHPELASSILKLIDSDPAFSEWFKEWLGEARFRTLLEAARSEVKEPRRPPVHWPPR